MRLDEYPAMQRLLQGRRWLKFNLNTRPGMMAVFGGMSIGWFPILCGVLIFLRFAPTSDQISLSALAAALGLTLLLPVNIVVVTYFQPITLPLTSYRPPRTVIVRMLVATAIYTIVVASIFIGVGERLMP